MFVTSLAPDFTGVVKFTANWCGPCKRIHEALQTACDGAGVLLVEVDVDGDSELPAAYQVNAMPTIVFVAHGTEMKELRVVGANMPQIEQNVRTLSSTAGRPVDANQIVLPVDDAANVQCPRSTSNPPKR